MERPVVTRSLAVLALALGGACSYDPSFNACEIECTTSDECPSGFACSGGLCRPAEAGASCSAPAPSCAGGPSGVLANGSFDAPDLPWRQEPASAPLICGPPRITPHSGMLAACLGGDGDNAVHVLSRDISLPPDAVGVRLTGRICISTDEVDPADNDLLTFDIFDGTNLIGRVGQRTNQQGSPTCSFTSFTLETQLIAAPPTATFRIRSMLDVGLSTSFFVDSLVLTVSCR